MNCGCDVDSVLMGFFSLKTWSVTSKNPKITYTESLKNDVIPARLRASFVEQYMHTGCVTFDDLYDPEYGTTAYKRRVREVQLQNLQDRCKSLGRAKPAVIIDVDDEMDGEDDWGEEMDDDEGLAESIGAYVRRHSTRLK